MSASAIREIVAMGFSEEAAQTARAAAATAREAQASAADDVARLSAELTASKRLVADVRLAGGSENVQHGVGGATHRDVEGHRVLERLLGADRAGEARVVRLRVCLF